MMDRESIPQHTIRILVDRENSGPPERISAGQILTVTIIVLDVNDNPPVFNAKEYGAGITSSDYLGKTLLKVVATDADLNDTITYSIVPGSIGTNNEELESVKNTAFELQDQTGDLTLAYVPLDNSRGYFEFTVEARDLADHTDQAKVKIYIIGDSNRVSFIFLNPPEVIKDHNAFVSID